MQDDYRVIYMVAPSVFGMFGWKVTAKYHAHSPTKTIFRTIRKKDAIALAVAEANMALKMFKEDSELLIMNMSGKFSGDKRTYGNDPLGNG